MDDDVAGILSRPPPPISHRTTDANHVICVIYGNGPVFFFSVQGIRKKSADVLSEIGNEEGFVE